MNAAIALLVFVTLQRLRASSSGTGGTRAGCDAAGAIEFGGLHYPAMMLVHAAWLAGLWPLGYDRPVIGPI